MPITGIIVGIFTFLYYVFRTNKKLAFTLFAFLAGFGIIYYAKSSPESKEFIFATSGRQPVWDYYWLWAKKSFIVGNGLGATNVLSSLTKFKAFNLVHNEYLQFLFELGIIGILLIAYCIWDYLKLKAKEHETIISKGIFLGFLIQSYALYPAHLWIPATTVVFLYAGSYILKNEELIKYEN